MKENILNISEFRPDGLKALSLALLASLSFGGLAWAQPVPSPHGPGEAAKTGKPTHPKYYKGRGPFVAGYYLNRNEDDFSYLSDPAKKKSVFDAIKHVNLTSDGGVYLTFNGDIRLRADSVQNKNLGIATGRNANGTYKYTNAQDQHVLYSRIEFGAALNIQQWATIYAEMIDGQETGKNIGTVLPGAQEDGLAFTQAYLELHNIQTPIHYGVRLGRQFIYLGNGLQLSPNYATNLPIPTFDAARVFLDTGAIRVDAFFAATIDYNNGFNNSRIQEGNQYWGLYTSFDLKPQHFAGETVSSTIEPFYIGYKNAPILSSGIGGYYDSVFVTGNLSSASSFSGMVTPGLDMRHTFGLRYYGKVGNLDFDWQGAAQFGSYLNYSVRAFAFNTETGYRVTSLPWTPRGFVRFNMATGGANESSHVLSTYQPMQTQAQYYSENSVIAPANLWNVSPGITVKPRSDVTLEVYDSIFWRYSLSDALYTELWEGGGGPNGFAMTVYNRARFVGNQPAFRFKWQVNQHLSLSGIAADFVVGPALSEAGAKDSAYFRLVGDFVF